MNGLWTATLNTSGTPIADSDLAMSRVAWRYVPSFQSYWISEGYTVSRITSASQAIAGNPIYWLASDGYQNNHVMLIVGTNAAGQVLVTAHNDDMYQYPFSLSSIICYTINIVHDHDYEVLFTTATTHTLSCTICEKQITENHYMQTFYGYQSCITCGYEVSTN